MKKRYDETFAHIREIVALSGAAGLLGWDQETMMPEEGAGVRAEQSSAIAGVVHERFVDPAIGRALRALAKGGKALTAPQRANVREALHDYEKSVRLPPELVRELAHTSTLAQKAWIAARRENDFARFAPWLKKTFALKRRQAEALGYARVPYDALLDDYEPGMTTELLDPIVEEVRAGLVPIVQAIAEAKKRIDTRCLTAGFPEEGQESLCREVMAAMGVDSQASRLDRSAHPFCIGFAPTDVRITTRYNPRWLPQALYGVMHESGHALYEQGLPIKAYGTPLGEAVSLGVHESQSRLWENMVGRGEPFVRFLFPKLKRRFPKPLRNVTRAQFFAAINRVTPSLIRVEADEVTYNLHIVLRYELEKALLDGAIKTRELPKLWKERMQQYLGITPKRDADGVMQDTHWASGLVGYFPTYLLGNLYAGQLWARIRADIRGLDRQLAKGDCGPLRAWLRQRVHRSGRRYPAVELIRRASGKKPSARFFLDYLREKYGALYDIRF